MRNRFDSTRDQRIAEESAADRSLMCSAHGCPNLWSVDPGRLCSAHAASDAAHWPAITELQQRRATERALTAAEPARTGPRRPPRREELEHLRRAVRQIGRPHAEPKAWAYALRDREQAGERLTLSQRSMWRDALGVEPAPAIDAGYDEQEAA